MTTDNVYDDDGKGNPNRIMTWLKMGKWTTEQATLLFLDIDPDTKYGDCFETLSRLGSVQYEYFDDDDPSAGRVPIGRDIDGEYDYLTTEQEDLLMTANKIYKDNVRILNQYDFATPHEWIGLALEKEISIPWLDWAIKNNLYASKKTDSSNGKDEETNSLKGTCNDDDKPWLIHKSNDPVAKEQWYIPARYFARKLLKDNPLLLKKRLILADNVRDMMKKFGIYKRGGKLQPSAETILKAFSNVNFG